MSDDVLITPASRKIEFKDSSGNVDGKIELNSSGDLNITAPGGGLNIGDTSADVYIGDGSANVDIIFEQNGEIRGTTGRTLTLGQNDSNITVDALNFNTSTSTLFKSQNGITSTRLSTTTNGTGGSGQESTSTAPHTLVGSNNANTQYALLATLPATGNGTLDHVTIEGELGSWVDSTSFRVKFNRRDSFDYDYTLFDHNPILNVARIVAYQASNGTVTIHARLNANSYGKFTYKITDAFQATIVDKPSLTTSTPAGTLIFDSNDTSTYPPTMKFPDNQKLEFGASSDLQIYHQSDSNGTNSHIADLGGGDLTLSGSNYIIFKSSPTGEYYAIFRNNSSCDLYYNNVKKFETTSTGAKVTGTLDVNGAYTLPTSDGSANQVLQTNGSGTLSFATVSGGTAADDITAGDAAVNLTTTSGDITIDAQGTDTDIIFKGTDGPSDVTALTLDMSEAGSATFNAHVYLKDNRYIGLGSTALNANSSLYDLRLRTDGVRGFIEAMNPDSGGGLTFKSDDYIFQDRSATATYATLAADGALKLTATDDGNTANPVLTLDRISSSPASGDFLGDVQFKGRNVAGEEIVYGSMGVKIEDSADGTEDSRLIYKVQKAGELKTVLDIKADQFKINNVSEVFFGDPVSSLKFEGATGDAHELTLAITDPTADRTVTIPDATGTILLNTGDQTLTGHFLPGADDTYDLGSSSAQWRDIYTGDINLNNTKTRDNEVDGTRGSWTIQEGADDLFLLNRLNGKKYRFKLEEMK